MKEIKIYSANDDVGMYQEENRLRGTFLHGELEAEMKFDIFCFSEKLDLNEGLHSFKINNREATLMLWEDLSTERKKWLGYLVYTNDDTFDWCFENYKKREQLI